MELYLGSLSRAQCCLVRFNDALVFQGKKLPANISDDAEEGDVSDEDSADEMEAECKLMNGDVRKDPKVEWGEESMQASVVHYHLGLADFTHVQSLGTLSCASAPLSMHV